MPLSSYYRDVVLDNIVAGHVSLHNGDPGATGDNEVTGGSYSRKALTTSAASGGAKANSSDLNWYSMPAVNGVSYVGLWDSASGGNFLWSLPLAVTRNVSGGATFNIPSGSLIFTAS